MGGFPGQGVAPISERADDPETFAAAAIVIAALDTRLDVEPVGSFASGGTRSFCRAFRYKCSHTSDGARGLTVTLSQNIDLLGPFGLLTLGLPDQLSVRALAFVPWV